MTIRCSNALSFIRRHSRHILLIIALAAAGGVLCALLLPIERHSVRQQLAGFPDSDIPAQHARLYVLAALCFLPAFAAFAYALGGTIARYITRRFLGMFTLCLSALFMIWLLLDSADHFSEFLESGNLAKTMFIYYGTRLPAILLLLLPYSLLLALLESLGKLSTNREIIAMIQAGHGVLRITLPLIVAGAFCTLLTLGLNYHWAPTADGRQDDILAEATGKQAAEAAKVMYRNTETRRLWMVNAFPPDYQNGQPLSGVEVTTTNAHQQLVSRLSASRAVWTRKTHQWTFDDALISHFSPGAAPEFVKLDSPLVIDGWHETPWQIIKPGLAPQYLGIPDLNAWLYSNALHPHSADSAPYLTHWHYRWAFPFTCLVTVLLSTPLAIHFSRRGPGGGVFLAVVLSAFMLLVNSVILAFGESGSLKPMVAAWLPNICFTLIGIYLYHRRISGRPIYHSLRRIFSPD